MRLVRHLRECGTGYCRLFLEPWRTFVFGGGRMRTFPLFRHIPCAQGHGQMVKDRSSGCVACLTPFWGNGILDTSTLNFTLQHKHTKKVGKLTESS